MYNFIIAGTKFRNVTPGITENKASTCITLQQCAQFHFLTVFRKNKE